MSTLTRRDCLRLALLGIAASALRSLPALADTLPPALDPLAQNAWALQQSSNFHAIYDQAPSRQAFFPFLQNVFHLFPERDLHQLIQTATSAQMTDRGIYRAVQRHLPSITPELAELRFALPALRKQKHEMQQETLQLLGSHPRIDGYLEVGTTGRYLSALRPHMNISGDTVLLHSQKPSYGIADIVERGQLSQLGHFVDMRDYAPIAPQDVADASLDLVTNFIGFHHAPSEKLDGFVRSLHRVLRPGGRMVVRDHDVSTDGMNRIVALAHDVFNMGLQADWAVNQREIRHFTSLAQLRSYLEARGFQQQGTELYQPGDPTHNALMLFVKV